MASNEKPENFGFSSPLKHTVFSSSLKRVGFSSSLKRAGFSSSLKRHDFSFPLETPGFSSSLKRAVFSAPKKDTSADLLLVGNPIGTSLSASLVTSLSCLSLTRCEIAGRGTLGLMMGRTEVVAFEESTREDASI